MATPRGAVRPITSRSVADQATDELRRALLAGTLAPGEEYSLRELAGMLDISFIPIRLALLAPAATTWDIRILTTLWRAGERYIRIGFGRLDPDPAEHERRGKAHIDLVAALRSRDPGTAAGIEEHLSQNEQTALGTLGDTPHS